MKIAKTIGTVVAFPTCFAFGFYWQDIHKGNLGKNPLLGINAASKTASTQETFQKIYSRILAEHIKRPDKKELKYSAMEGLVASLGDPHTNFFEPKTNSEFRDVTQGKFYGIGARLLPDPLGVKVVSVFSGGPADKAGVKANDIVIAVDGKNVGGMQSDDIVMLIKGKEGSAVHLKVARTGSSAPLEFTIRREKVVPPNVESKFIESEQIGYIKIISFALEVPEQFDRELASVESHGIKGLVIDLRDNPGGALDAAAEVLSKWIDGQNVAKLKFRDGHEEVTDTERSLLHNFKYPVVVLVNDDSASAAEIMAGALKDYGKVTLVGDHTYGKFSVQTVFQEPDSAGIKVTIAKYYLPKSGALSRKVDEEGGYISGGILPDVKVDLDPDKEFDPATMTNDAQFAKAVEIIKSKQK